MTKSLSAASLFHAESDLERPRRWRLILGKSEAEQPGQSNAEAGQGDNGEDPASSAEEDAPLSAEDQALDDALEALYGDGGGNRGGLGDAKPDIARHLGNIREYFPEAVAEFVQHDALSKLNLRQLLKDPDLLDKLEPDLNLVSRLMSLQKLMPEQTKATAREVVKKVVAELIEQLEYPLLQAVQGSLKRNLRARNPRKLKEVNWLHTIKANLKHYQPQQRTIIPETLISYGRQRSSLHDIILCLDQSGSMAKSVVYASIFASVMASVPALNTKLVLFDTNVVDMSEHLNDPVELLFGVQLRGGTNIAKALSYCQRFVAQPSDTVLVLISDLFESGDKTAMLKICAELVQQGVQIVVLLALNDDGAPRFNKQIAEDLAALDIPSFACTPDLFPDLMGSILSRQDIGQWASQQNIVRAPFN